MSSPTNKRPTALLNLGDFVREEISATPPVNVPSRRFNKPSKPISSTAPSERADFWSNSPSDSSRGYSASLIGPVMDEAQVLSTSSTSVNSSVVMRHHEAAATYGATGTVQSRGRAEVGGKDKPAVNFEDEFEKIQMRNEYKRFEHSTTNFQTFIHVVKGNIGTGLLALPLAVGNAGLYLGPIALFFMGVIATHCMMLLLDSANHLCKQKKMPCLNYAETAAVAAGLYTTNTRYIKAASVVVNIFLIITQFGFCSVYFVFMADSLDEVFCQVLNVSIGKHAWIAILITPVVIFCWIRNLEELASFSLVANMSICFCLFVIFYEEIYSFFAPDSAEDERAAILRNPEKLTHIGNIKTIALFFGSVVYAFEGIGMVLPLENKMKTPSMAKSMVFAAMVLVTLLYFIFGTMGYIVFGPSIKATVTLNLASETRLWASILFVVVKLYFTYAIFASYMLQFYVPMDFLEPAFLLVARVDRLQYYFPNHFEKLKTLIQLGFRTVLVLLTAMIAMAVPDLEDLIALIGAVASSGLALIFPALFEIAVFWPDRNKRRFCWVFPWPVWVVKDCLILLLGVVGLVFGAYASITSIVASFRNKDSHQCITLLYRH